MSFSQAGSGRCWQTTLGAYDSLIAVAPVADGSKFTSLFHATFPCNFCAPASDQNSSKASGPKSIIPHLSASTVLQPFRSLVETEGFQQRPLYPAAGHTANAPFLVHKSPMATVPDIPNSTRGETRDWLRHVGSQFGC